MRKLQKIVSILRGAFISLAVLILTVMLVMEMPSVQTWLSHKLLDRFADNPSFEITCGRILVRPFHTVVIRDLLVIDKHPHEAAVEKLALLDDKSPVDTFAAAGLVEARLSFRTLLGGGPVEFGKILVKDGVFNLVIEPSLYPQLPAGNNLIRIFGINPTLPKPEDDGKVKFKAKNVKVRNFHYTMRNVSGRRPPVNDRGIDWGDLDTYGINCDAHDLMLKGMVMSGVCDHLDAHEKSGYFLSHISAAAEVGGGRAYVSDIHLDDGHSDAYLDHYAMYFRNARTFLHFVDSVSIDGHINRGSHLDSYSLQYFVPIFWEKEMSMDVHGDVVGTLTDLNVCGLRIDSVNLREKNGCPRMSDLTAFSASFDGHISGITDMHTPRRPISARARLDSCRTTATDFYAVAMRFLEGATASATGLPFDWAGTMILHPEIELEGSTDSDFKASVSIDAGEFREFGNLRCTAVAAGLPGNAPDPGTPSASGKAPSAPTPLTADIILSSTDLNLKPFTGNENLGPVSLEARCSMTIPNGTENILKEADIDLSSLEINRLQFKGYDYSGICASGKLSSGKARLSLLGRDPSLDCDLSASGNLNFKTADISLDLRDFALSETKLFGKDNVRTSLVLDAALAPEYSEVALTDMTLSRSGDSTAIPSVSAIAVRDSTGYGITVTSDMVEAVYRGDDNPVKFVENFIALALKKNVPGLFRDSGFESDGKRYSLDVTSGDLSPLLGFFAPSLSIESGTSLKTVISEEGMVNADLRAKHVIYKNAVADGLKFNFSNRQNAARAMLLATDIRLKDRKISSPSVQVYGSSGNIGLGISYDREDMSGGHGELFVRGQIDRNDPQNRLGISLEILPSTIYFSSSSWKIGRSSAEILGNAFKINDFNASCRDRNIFVSGSHGFTDRDKLRLYVENLDLSVVDDIMKNVELGLKGIIHGDMVLDSRGVTGRFLSEDTFIGGTALGTLEITDRWSDEDQKFHFRVNTDRMIKVAGDLSPKTKEINAGVVLDSLDISFARIFAKDVIGDIRGGLSGNIILGGTLPDFTLRSEGLNLVSGSVNVIPTGATYLLSGPLNITEDNFDVNLKIGDSSEGSGNISGGFRHDRFKNMNLGLNLEHSRLQTIALEPSRQRPYSGSLRTSGKIAVSGPTDNLSVDGTISTAGEGKVNVDISNMAPENSNQILSFVQKKNDEDGTPSGMLKHTTRKSGIKINAGINIDAETGIKVSLNEVENNMTINGQGLVEMELDPSRDVFNLNGNYDILSGDVHLLVLGLVGRNFTIKKGSSIIFGGDIKKSTLDVSANYRTKASLSNLIADSTAVGLRRNVDCSVHMTGRLTDPELSFAIDIPELDPSVKSMVESALSTEDKIQKQFVALLVGNSFLPDEQSGIENATSATLFSNVSGIMSNQLSNIFRKLNIPLDLGLKYQPGNYGNDMFDVAISTQLFNNRVIINGNLGNRRYESSQGSIAGDLEVEFKVNRSGSLRVNVFTRSTDSYTNYLDNLQRTGAGVSYQKEYDNFGKMVKYIFSSKPNRDALDEESRRAEISGERRILAQ